ncbi:arrestin domain-containing protein, partial [Metarhizium majus ARSEF 297]
MNSWTNFPDGVPHMVYQQMERHEPSAHEKIRTAHVVPATERGADAVDVEGHEREGDIDEILARLHSAEVREEFAELAEGSQGEQRGTPDVHERGSAQDGAIFEISAAGMFGLDGAPEITELEKFKFACDTIHKGGHSTADGQLGRDKDVSGSAGIRYAKSKKEEPYIHISRGDNFADGLDRWFFAKAFPTLFPYGLGGPRLAEEALVGSTGSARHEKGVGRMDTSGTATNLVGSRNMSLRAWAEIVLRRHGGRFANHHKEFLAARYITPRRT